MWRNYLTVGFRALTRSKTYAFINVFGLALGLAACLMLLVYVRYETSYDRWLPDAERIYQVQAINTTDENPRRTPQQAAHGIITESLADDFPQIEEIARLEGNRPVFLRDGEPVFVDVYYSDDNLFRILQLPFLRGDPATALRGTESLVLSRTQAMNMFGSIDVLGRTVTTILRGEQASLRVTGIFEDIPRNSHMDFSAFARIPTRTARNAAGDASTASSI
jgi:putative ABC transport system permease protein